MEGDLYVFSRRVKDHNGQTFSQLVTVFASTPSSARRLLALEVGMIEDGHGLGAQADPKWGIERITLDSERVVTSLLTT